MTKRVGAYAKLLANYASDDAIIAVGEPAELLFVRALAFLSTSDSDGFITDGQLSRVVGAGMRDAAKRAKALVREGLWEREADGYQVRSWLKIHDAAEEKGRKRATDRERKRQARPDAAFEGSVRIPSGHAQDSDPHSERTRNENTPESLNCSVVTEVVPRTEQSTTEQSSALIPVESEPPTAQAIVAAWADWAPKRPPAQVVAQVSKNVTGMLAEGIDPDDLRRGLAAWTAKGLHPSTLPSVVHEVMNRSPGNRNQQDTDAMFERAARRMGVTA